jgi:hypothetical protein
MSEYKVNRVGIIEYNLKNAFPKSEIKVFEHISSLAPAALEYVAYVDNVGAVVTVLKDRYYSTAAVSSKLIYLINERRKDL